MIDHGSQSMTYCTKTTNLGYCGNKAVPNVAVLALSSKNAVVLVLSLPKSVARHNRTQKKRGY
jgi:hypothetical protein